MKHVQPALISVLGVKPSALAAVAIPSETATAAIKSANLLILFSFRRNAAWRAMNNPLSLLKFLTGVASDLRNAGSEQVRDAETTHYEGILNLQNVVESAPPQERADLKDTLDFIGQFEPTSVPFGLWVDGDGVARRLRIDQKDGGSTVIEYYDFGLPVSITPPPPDAIITFEELFKEVEAHQTESNCEGDQSSPDGPSYSDQLTLPENPGTSPAEVPAFVPSGSATYYVCSTIGGG